jgi:hypothetical protein
MVAGFAAAEVLGAGLGSHCAIGFSGVLFALVSLKYWQEESRVLFACVSVCVREKVVKRHSLFFRGPR